MKNVYVLVADMSQANLFALRWLETMGDGKPCELTPVLELQNEERRQRDSEIFADSRPGLQSAAGGGHAHGVDDGREAERAESDRRFAQEIVSAVRERVQEVDRATLVVVASPNMLGHLRKAADPWPSKLRVRELDKQLRRLSPVELHEYLAKRDLLPARGRVI